MAVPGQKKPALNFDFSIKDNTTLVWVEEKYNWQVDNSTVVGKLAKSNPTGQCGYTSCAMVLSFYIKQAEDDSFIKTMIEQFEKGFLNKGENRAGTSLNYYVEICDFYLKTFNIQRRAKMFSHSGTLQNMVDAIGSGSGIMAGTMLSDSGHFIEIHRIDLEKRIYTCNDPYGKKDFKTGKYLVTPLAGKDVQYSFDELTPFLVKSSNIVSNNKFGGARFLYLAPI